MMELYSGGQDSFAAALWAALGAWLPLEVDEAAADAVANVGSNVLDAFVGDCDVLR